MAATSIEWCHYTFNHVIGCTKVAPGCTHCYAEAYANRYGKAEWGPSGTRVKTSASYWRQPLKWNRQAQAAGERRRVFCASLADVFEDWQGPIVDAKGREIRKLTGDPECMIDRGPATMDDLRRDLFALIDQTPWLDWIVLTKRPENINRMWRPLPHNGRDPSDPLVARRDNVWLLTSVSDQPSADKNIPELLTCRDLAPVLGVSAEPLLGAINFGQSWEVAMQQRGWAFHSNWGAELNECPNCVAGENQSDSGYDCSRCFGTCIDPKGIDWIICGGESGHNARPCNLAWIRSIRDQCAAAGVACFIKQLGANVIDSALTGQRAPAISGGWPAGTRFATVLDDERYLVPGRAKLRDPKGGDISEWPESLRVREFPQATTV